MTTFALLTIMAMMSYLADAKVCGFQRFPLLGMRLELNPKDNPE